MKIPTCSCPYCGIVIPIQNILQGRKANEAHGRCLQCEKWVVIELPSASKKLVYLDQSFLSAVCLEADNAKSSTAVSIFSKIKKLKERQKIFVLISGIHSRETVAIPEEHIERRRKLWSFQNDLADGCISADWYEVFVAQQRRQLVNPSDIPHFPVTDIGLRDPHQRHVGMRVQLTNHWHQKLDAANARPRPAINENYRQILDCQVAAIPRCDDIYDCLTFVRDRWQKDILQGIGAWQDRLDQMAFMLQELESGRIPDINRLKPTDALFRQAVDDVVERLDVETSVPRWLQLLEGSSSWCASVRIRTAFEAELLWQWASIAKPKNPKTFNDRFGLSRQNDIDHVSAFVPYVDALTTDNDMFNLCNRPMVASELTLFPCKIFAKKNYAKFDLWLDALMAEPDDSIW